MTGVPPRAVLFDLDETLIVEEAAVVDALLATAARAAASRAVDPASLATAVRRTARARWRALPTWPFATAIGISSWEGLCGRFEGDGEDLVRLRAMAPSYRVGSWSDALREHGVSDEDLARTLADAYLEEHAGRRVAYPETAAVLEALRPRVRLAVVTNGASDLQREKLARSGLAGWFDVVTVSGDVGAGKPDRRVFDRTLAALGVEPAHAVMVGDNAERDVAGAQAAGMRAVWVDRLGRPPPADVRPDWRVADLAGLPSLLLAAPS